MLCRVLALLILPFLGACGEQRLVLGEGRAQGDTLCTHPVFCASGSSWTFEERDGNSMPALDRDGEMTATRFVVTRTGGYARFARRVDSPVAEGELHLAVQLRVASGFAIRDWVVLMEAKGPNGKVSLDLSPIESWQLFTDTLSTSSASPPLARDTWLCATLSLAISKVGWAKAEVEGGPALKIEPADTLRGGGIDTLYFGLTTSTNQIEPSEAVFDALRVSSSPLTCP